MCLRLFKTRLHQAISKPNVIPVPVQPDKQYGLIDVHEQLELIKDTVVDVEVDRLVKKLESYKNPVIVLKF